MVSQSSCCKPGRSAKGREKALGAGSSKATSHIAKVKEKRERVRGKEGEGGKGTYALYWPVDLKLSAKL